MKRSYSVSIKRGLEYIQLKGHIHTQEKGNGFHSQKITERQNGSAAIKSAGRNLLKKIEEGHPKIQKIERFNPCR